MIVDTIFAQLSYRSAKLVFVVMMLYLTVNIAFATNIGQVIRSQNMPEYPVGSEVVEDTEIVTGAMQKIAVKTADGDVLIAGNNSMIKIVKPGFFSQIFGRIYYFFTSKQDQEVTVRTSFATIGIRGTKFIVNTKAGDESADEVSLVAGKLNFQSNDGEPFELYQQRELSEFEQFKRQQQKDFNAYRQGLIEEFVAFKSSVNLNEGFALAFDGKKATKIKLSDDINEEIEAFEHFISDQQAQ